VGAGKMVDIDVDVITVTAYKCVHCGALFADRDLSFEHLDKCMARATKKGTYLEDTEFGNMVLNEAIG
jgi:hypothetical protein